MRAALCGILMTFLIILADFGGTLSHMLRESYGLVTETLRREGYKVSIWLENNLIIAVSHSAKDMSIV